MTYGGRLFQRRLPATGDARSLTVYSHVHWITSCEDDNDRLYCLCFRLQYDKDGSIHPCGFSSADDATRDELDLWLPQQTTEAMAVDTAKYIISHVGAEFCTVIEQEKSAMSWTKPGGLLACCM